MAGLLALISLSGHIQVTIDKIVSEQDMKDCFYVLRKVFIESQNVPAEREVDRLDSEADHYLLKVDGVTAGTARVRFIKNKAKVERVAILPHFQGKGLGKKFMEYLIVDIKKSEKVEIIVLSSQVSAIPFYLPFGFKVVGDEYIDGGIPHKDMEVSV